MPGRDPKVGAHGGSGVICALVSVLACLRPKTTLLVGLIVPMPAWLCLAGLFAWDAHQTMTNSSGRTDTAARECEGPELKHSIGCQLTFRSVPSNLYSFCSLCRRQRIYQRLPLLDTETQRQRYLIPSILRQKAPLADCPTFTAAPSRTSESPTSATQMVIVFLSEVLKCSDRAQ